MKKSLTLIIVFALTILSVFSLASCSLLGGGITNPPTTDTGDGTEKDDGSDDVNGNTAETTMEITGEIPFNLNNDFYFSIDMKPINSAMNPKSATFTAIRKNDDDGNGGTFSSIYANYTYYVYKNFENYLTGTYKEKYIEQRTLYEGIDFRKSFGEERDTSDDLNELYNEDWNTEVPDGTTMTTTIKYIENFLKGNHIADVPYSFGGTIQTKRIPSDLSTDIHQKDVGIPGGSTDFYVYADGTEDMTFARLETASTVYNQPAYSASVTKYKGVYYEKDVANVKVWGNIVVSATPVQGNTPLLKKEISTKFSTEVTQETFEVVIAAFNWIEPVIE